MVLITQKEHTSFDYHMEISSVIVNFKHVHRVHLITEVALHLTNRGLILFIHIPKFMHICLRLDLSDSSLGVVSYRVLALSLNKRSSFGQSSSYCHNFFRKPIRWIRCAPFNLVICNSWYIDTPYPRLRNFLAFSFYCFLISTDHWLCYIQVFSKSMSLYIAHQGIQWCFVSVGIANYIRSFIFSLVTKIFT